MAFLKCFLQLLMVQLILFSIWSHQICFAGYMFEVVVNNNLNDKRLFVTVTSDAMNREELNSSIDVALSDLIDDERVSQQRQGETTTTEIDYIEISGLPTEDLINAWENHGIRASSLVVSGESSSLMPVSAGIATATPEHNPVNQGSSSSIQGLMRLATVLNVRRLVLAENGFGNEDAAIIASSLPMLESVEELILSRNRIGAQGAVFLANALNNSSLRSLDLSENPIGADGHESFAAVLALPNIQLQSLDLSYTTEILPAAAWGIAIFSNRGLERLCLHGKGSNKDDLNVHSLSDTALTANSKRKEEGKPQLGYLKLIVNINSITGETTWDRYEADDGEYWALANGGDISNDGHGTGEESSRHSNESSNMGNSSSDESDS